MDSAKADFGARAAMSEATPRASLAPIVVALLSIVSVSLLGFVVALWPEEPRSAPARPQAVNAAPRPLPQSYEGGSLFIPEPRKHPGKWT
jgi:hypothetical protein